MKRTRRSRATGSRRDPAADVDKNAVSARGISRCRPKTAEYYTSQAPRPSRIFEDGSRRGACTPSRTARAPLASLALVRFGDARQKALDPAKVALLSKKEDLERQIDILKYQKAAMAPSDYETQLKNLLVGLARLQVDLDK
jgi:hypothetical protein